MDYKSLILLILFVFPISLSTRPLFAQNNAMPQGKMLFESLCNKCHALSKPLSKQRNLQDWNKITKRMSEKTNSNIKLDEAKLIAEYLASIQNK